MKLAIFGSTGGIGRQIVEQALEQGHEVTAFTRSPERLTQNHRNLRVVKGDVLDPASVEHAIAGQDAVLCALGMPILNNDKLRAKGTRNIVRAMEKTGVKRLVCLSMIGVGDSWDILPFHYKFLIFPLILRRACVDHGLQENHVQKSPLDWVIVRPGNFSKGPRTGAYRHGFTAADTAPTLKISQPDVADFMLKQMADSAYLRQSPALSY